MSTTADPRSIAFDILARHASDEAASVLLQALDCDDEQARKLAAATVIKRRGQQSILEIIRRADSLDEDACREFSRWPERFRVALGQAISNSDDETRNAAITFIRRTGNFDQFTTLLDQIDSEGTANVTTVEVALVELATKLAQRLRSNDESIFSGWKGASLRQQRSAMLNELDLRTKRFDLLSKPETHLRLILTLGGPDDAAVRNVLTKRGNNCRDAAVRLLKEDSQPALLNLLCDFLAYHAPPAIALKIVRERNDFEFVLHFLKQLPKQPSGYLAINLARLNGLSWLQDSMEIVEQLPASVHDRLVAVIDHAPLEEETRTRLKAWIIRQSGASGREAASDVLKTLPQEEANQILHEALQDADAEVEAWATHHLRAQKLPGTFEELVKRLDRNIDVVRDAARDELFSFDLNYLLKIFGDLSPGHSRQCGKALLKINPNATQELIREINHPFRRRRIRAIVAAEALGLLNEVHSSLLEKLNDPEASVRCAAIQALGSNPSAIVLQAIRKMTGDPHRQVRSAAENVITTLNPQLKSAQPQTEASI